MTIARYIVNLVKRLVGAEMANVHTHVLCQVISYDDVKNTCALQPCIMRIRLDDPSGVTEVTLPVLEDVPVYQFGSGKCLLSVAPQKDSYGELHVSERSIARWVEEGGIVAPGTIRKFDISDGIFHPAAGINVPDALGSAVKTDRIELRTRPGTGYVAVLDDGNVEIDGAVTVKVGGASATEPAMQGTKFMAKDNAHTHSTAFGPSGPPLIPWVAGDFSTKVKVG